MTKDFLENLMLKMKEQLGEDYLVEHNHVVKNNGTELDGISILKKNEQCMPVLYVDEYYKSYLKGVPLEKIVEMLLKIYEKERIKNDSTSEEIDMSYDKASERIVYRLVNYEKNQNELRKVPHIRFLDLAITFHCLVRIDEGEIGTIRVTNLMIEDWEITVQELWYLAKKNTPNLFPVQIRAMADVIREIIKKELSREMQEAAKEYFDGDFLHTEMYILTNRSGINGAAAILYEDAIQQIAEIYQSDFYVLPSSIHEVILIPYQENYMREELCAMVYDINRTQVPDEDILSDKVYLYKRDLKFFEL